MKKISRRTALIGAGALAAAYGAYRIASPAGGERPRIALKTDKGRRPNILFILTDQERARHLLPASLPLPQHDRHSEKNIIVHSLDKKRCPVSLDDPPHAAQVQKIV